MPKSTQSNIPKPPPSVAKAVSTPPAETVAAKTDSISAPPAKSDAPGEDDAPSPESATLEQSAAPTTEPPKPQDEKTENPKAEIPQDAVADPQPPEPATQPAATPEPAATATAAESGDSAVEVQPQETATVPGETETVIDQEETEPVTIVKTSSVGITMHHFEVKTDANGYPLPLTTQEILVAAESGAKEGELKLGFTKFQSACATLGQALNLAEPLVQSRLRGLAGYSLPKVLEIIHAALDEKTKPAQLKYLVAEMSVYTQKKNRQIKELANA